MTVMTEAVTAENLDGRYTNENTGAEIAIKKQADSSYYIEANMMFRQNVAYIEGTLSLFNDTTGVYSEDGYSMTITWSTPDFFTVTETGEPGGVGTSFAGNYGYAGPVEG